MFGPLINAAMNDNKKLMRDTAMDALEKSTRKLDTEGGGSNPFSMESFMSSMVGELEDSEFKIKARRYEYTCFPTIFC